MEFDPTFNYGKLDLSNESNLIFWKFGEFIKTLITLSSDAKRQAEIIGVGAVCEEMVADFDSYFTLSCQTYIDKHLLTEYQAKKLKELDDHLNERGGGKTPDFWDDSLLDTNPNWLIVRQKAKTILELLGMQDLTIEFDREEKYETTDDGKRLAIQTTKTRLIRKCSS